MNNKFLSITSIGQILTLIRNASNLTIPALVDSFPIEATLFQSPSPTSKKTCVVISEATGCRRQFYSPLAEYLSQKHNLDVITYDYRGTHVRQSTEWNIVEHWARRDCTGVLTYGFQNYDDVVFLGHSLGGNLLAVLPASINQRLARIALISCTNSYHMYRKWNINMLGTILSLHLMRELMIWFYGYFPLRTLLKSGVDMPKGIPRQWAYWVRHPDCFVDDRGQMYTEGFNAVQCPMLAVHFEDDEFYTRKAFDLFTEQFKNASNSQSWHLPKGGHFRFFKEKQSRELWEKMIPFLKYGQVESFAGDRK